MKTLASLLLAALTTLAHARETTSIDSDWAFHKGDIADAQAPAFDDSSWQKVTLPHDWAIAGPFDKNAPATGSGGWLPTGISWYRKTVTLREDLGKQNVWLEFDGIMANSDVWLNGQHLGHRPNGYTSLRYDATGIAKPGANVLAVKSDTSAQPASRWYAGSGIYRHARLVLTSPSHIAPWGVFVSTKSSTSEKATIHIETNIVSPEKLALRSEIRDSQGNTIVSAESPATALTTQDIDVANPALWSLESPTLHTLTTTLLADGRPIDQVTTPFGIRTAEFRSDTGFWLNGKNIKIKGACLHCDGGAVGVAVPLAVWERRLKQLKEIGTNAIRTAHNPPDPGFLDLCDRMGLLVMDEFFDCWTKGKNPHDYHLYFKEWSHTDLRDGILRDRNHPSIILYSVGNEIHDTPHPEIAIPILKGLVEVCHQTDPTRPVTQALFRPNVSKDYDNGLADLLDVIGTNYRDLELLQAWKDKPSRKIIGTEQSHERSIWLACRDNPQHAGQFIWAGIDYLGESRRWPLTLFNKGFLDRTGAIQPRGYERQSWWSDKPNVHAFRRTARTGKTPDDPGYEVEEWVLDQVLFPDWNPSDTTAAQNVEVYSNAQEVELFLNDKSLGKKATPENDGPLNWKVPFEPGTLKAIATTDGKVVATDTLTTAGKPAKIALTSDHPTLGTSWEDVAHIQVAITDENGTVCPTADPLVKFTIDGPGKIIAVDSGNIISTEPFQDSQRKAYQGRCLAIVRATGPGKITLTATAESLPPAPITLEAK